MEPKPCKPATPLLPDQLLEQAMEIAREWFIEYDAVRSLHLASCFEREYGRPDVSDEEVDRYYSETWAPDAIRTAWLRIQDLVSKDGPSLSLWRAVTIENDPLDGMRRYICEKGGIGTCWAHDARAAHPHDGDDRDVPGYVIAGRADPESIDWPTTLATYAHPDWVGEEEIRLRPDAEVTLIGLTVYDASGEFRGSVDLAEMDGIAVRAGTHDDMADHAASTEAPSRGHAAGM